MEKVTQNILNKEGAMRVFEEFAEEFNGPDRESYISYFDVKKIKEVDSGADASGEEYCFVVGLRESLPKGLELPSVYRGVKVYIK